MVNSAPPKAPAAHWLWPGRALSGFVVLFLLFSSVIKLIGRPEVAQTFTELGYPTKFAIAIGIIELVCILLYAVPRTAVLGAVLLTALLGGAIATRLRAESPLFSHTLFGAYLGVIAWVGLILREPRLWQLLPLRSS
jgi:hypothetical protein